MQTCIIQQADQNCIDAYIHKERGRGRQKIFDEDSINGKGIGYDPEMRRGIVFNVNRGNCLGVDFPIASLRLKQHIGLIFKSVPLNIEQLFHKARGNYPKTCLRILNIDASGHPQDVPGQNITEFAAQGHLLFKVSDAQNQCIPVRFSRLDTFDHIS